MQRLIVAPPRHESLHGTVPLPASKYHAHRALILGSLAEGESRITGRTGALHVRATLAALRRLGTRIVKEPGGYRVWGGPYRPSQPRIPVGSSGTTLQFLLGLGCRSVGPALVFDGQKYLHHRPIGPLLDGLRALGVRLDPTGDRLPVTVYPGRPTGGRVEMPGTLSQWISGLLLLAPLASGDTEIVVAADQVNEKPYLDLTMRMMARFGIDVEVGDGHREFRVRAGQRYVPADVVLPADLASAAFALVAAAVMPGDVTFTNIDADPDHPEKEILDVLRHAGVPMRFDAERRTLRIANPDGRRPEGVHVDCTDAPDMVPILCVLGALSRGDTVLDHVAHARLKESDRVKAMLQLRKMGARIDEEPDRLVIHGVERLRPATISSFNDHRVLMAFAVAGSVCTEGRTEVSYPRAYRISYPEFLDQMRGIGLDLSVQRVDAAEGEGPWSSTPTRGSTPALVSMMPSAWVETHRHSGLWPQRLVTDYLADAAAWTPDRPAVVDGRHGGRTLTYRELSEAVDRCATGLVRLGVRPGEPVAFQLPNWWEFVVTQLALVRIGAVSCPLMPIFRKRELRFMLAQSGCRLLIVPKCFRGYDYVALAQGVRADLPKLERILVVDGEGPDGWSQLLEAPADPDLLESRRPSPDDITQLLYTSGTSGEPKGVLHTHNTLLGALAAHIRHFGLTDRDGVLIPSPAAHQTGFLYGMWLAVVLGSTAIYQDVWDADRALALADEWRFAFVQAATPFLADLCEAARKRGRGPSGLRVFVATGAPVPRVLAQMARGVLHSEVIGGWGTTESGLVAGGSPGDAAEKLWQTDGRVIAPMRMRVVDADGRDVPAGEEGRFQVWTPAMFVGYLGHPEWYRAAFTGEGWFDTGDLATMDAEGFMRITGRTKDVINRGGEKVPVAEVEELLYAHPDVAQVAVVGMPDARLGERACAFVVLRSGAGLTLDDVQRHLAAAGTAKQYWPERVEVVASLPRTPSGKIQKYVLRAQIAERLEAEEKARRGVVS